ncbi:hypothetical protein Barb4_03813 [Bacteroidales bacterium Barb4]|nr:hypothetical protein Barb4_03813 [Bacteroidales bacterium Barb4]
MQYILFGHPFRISSGRPFRKPHILLPDVPLPDVPLRFTWG